MGTNFDIEDGTLRNTEEGTLFRSHATGQEVLFRGTRTHVGGWFVAPYGAFQLWGHIFIGRRWYQPQNVPEYELPACLDHGVSAGVRFPVGRAAVSLSVQGLNLAGRCYELVRSYPMPGRQFRITIKITI